MISRKNSAQFLMIGALIIAALIAVIASRRAARFEDSVPAETEVTGTTMPDLSSGTAAPVPPKLSAIPKSGAAQLQVLGEILDSKNDNDPRLDQELRELNAETKSQFRAKYQSLPLEKRNQRGLIVFLLGRNLTESVDFDFVQSVLSEAPCLSMANCAEPSPNATGSGVGISAAYPQLVALESLSGYLKKLDMPEQLHARAWSLLVAAQKSKVAEVQNQALKLVRSDHK
jgi:hypothetical protein